VGVGKKSAAEEKVVTRLNVAKAAVAEKLVDYDNIRVCHI